MVHELVMMVKIKEVQSVLEMLIFFEVVVVGKLSCWIVYVSCYVHIANFTLINTIYAEVLIVILFRKVFWIIVVFIRQPSIAVADLHAVCWFWGPFSKGFCAHSAFIKHDFYCISDKQKLYAKDCDIVSSFLLDID